ncbi:MAG: DUF4443 domain-containing protein [Candidatus Thermoplasmatota archaeon]
MGKRGAPPTFELHHLLRALYLICDHERLGRKRLAELLQIGEGTCRGVLGVLRGRGLITVGQRGIALSAEGREFIDSLPIAHGRVDLNKLALARFTHAIALRDHARFVRTGIEQRDDAVGAGAVGATALVCRRGRLHFPDGTALAEQFLEDEMVLVATFRPMDGDLILLGYGRTEESAGMGAFAAAAGVLAIPILAAEVR